MKLAEKLKKMFLKIIDWFISKPKRVIRFLVLFVCSIVVAFQLCECLMKLLNPPISTHSHFDLNGTLHYPAVTFCREPAFKEDILSKYNLSIHPSMTSSWKNFPFETSSLSDVFEESTYSREEFFNIYALNGNRSNIAIDSTMTLTYGRCFTLKPRVSTDLPWKSSGYSITLRHDHKEEFEDASNTEPPGFHVYLHDPRETFTEHGILSSGRIEYIYLYANEEMELKLTVQQFTKNRARGIKCSDNHMKSTSICHEMCRWKSVEEVVKCVGPWIKHSSAPQCNNYHDVRDLIVQYKYLSTINESVCGCLEPCLSVLYSSFVMYRKRFSENGYDPGSQIYIYYTSKMITNIEERAGYDFSQFIADMGGSLGFLLGLSVIGLIVALEKILGYLFLDKLIKNNEEKANENVENAEKAEKHRNEPSQVF
ncbi:CLUMA_CG006903, isoform A [Clunio marinus]|uniref:CLUMA_CG006903, isoform A n=1 Tax=Clunio marinus TaxID=568069 RepID=A0A1J1I0R4_9DIPT|nr:CLUMA_CG006903, isoform A [Clunio marinus]